MNTEFIIRYLEAEKEKYIKNLQLYFTTVRIDLMLTDIINELSRLLKENIELKNRHSQQEGVRDGEDE
jgi:hypothetical protein